MTTRLRRSIAVLLLALVVALPIPAIALLVRPVLLELTTSGSDVTGTIEVINDRNRPIAVEIAVNRLALPERGELQLTPDDGAEFQIFPTVASIAPGGRQVFRVRWIGDPVIPESRLYMFTTSELPVSEDPDATTVQVLYAINSVVTVRSPSARPNITINSVRRVTRPDGQVGAEVLFQNSGPAHGFVTSTNLEFSIPGGSWSHVFRPADLNNAFGIGLVPANATRAMFIAIPDLPSDGELEARLRAAPIQN